LEGSVCVSDIAKQTELSQSLVSHHLRLLRTARLVKSERRGRNVHYVINDDHIRCVLVDMIDHVFRKIGDRSMSYYFSAVLSVPFDAAVQRVVEALKQEGFGIITEIDVKDTLKKKINIDFHRYPHSRSL
jgi:DNA-binding transcriptional ArsR family regulator